MKQTKLSGLNLGVIFFALTLVAAGCNLYPSATPAVPPSMAPTPVVAPSPNAVTSPNVSIQNFAFNPGTLTVKKGTTVTWTNNDVVPHEPKSNTFDSGPLANGQSFSFTFNQTGTFDYSCAIHPSMTGKIIVE